MRIGLLGRIALALVAVGLLPVALVTWQLIGLNRDAMTSQVRTTHAVAARTAAERVAAYLSTVLIPVQAATGRPEFLADPSGEAAQALLAGVLQAQPLVLAVEMTDPAGVRAYLLQRREYADVVTALLAKGKLGEVEVWHEGTASWLRLDQPLRDGAGWMRVVAAAEPLGEVLAPAEIGEDAEIVLLEQGSLRVLLASAGAAGPEAFPGNLRAAVGAGPMTMSGRYGDTVAALAPVPGWSWVVVSRQPAAIADELAARTRARGLLAALTAGLLALAFSGLAWSSVVKPIRDLVAATRRELAGREEGEAALPGGNELDALRRSFEVLARRVRERAPLEDVRLGRYAIQRELGHGAMGSVFLARDPKLGRDVAIKTISLGKDLPGVRREEIVSLLLREARLIAKINHENIVAVYDVEESPSSAFVTMEYVEGVTLDALILRRGRLGVDAALHVGLGIARGLEAAHAHGIVHHDIKPPNVLVRRDGAVKIMDFGIAEAVSALAEKRDQIFGTPGYLPPETLRGKGRGPLGDVFALGVTLYECLAGEPPFAGKDLRSILLATVRGRPAPLGSRNPEVPPELAGLVGDLMEGSPERRVPSARVARERLESMNKSLGGAVTAEIPVVALPSLENGATGKVAEKRSRTRFLAASEVETIDIRETK